MADQAGGIQTDRSMVGPSSGGSLCRQDDCVTTKLRLLASGPERYTYGCVYAPMDEVDTSIRKSSLEFNRPGTSENYVGTTDQRNFGDSLLAERDLVPSPASISSVPSVITSPTGRPDHVSNDNTPFITERLDALRVEIISSKLQQANLGDLAMRDMLFQALALSLTNKTYRKYHLRFLSWALGHSVSPTTFSGADLVIFLAYSKQTHGLQASTLRTVRAAIVHLHTNPQALREDPLVNSYLATITKQAPPTLIHKSSVDMTPSLVFADSIPSRTTTSLHALQGKLAFLLAMAAFLRPSDLARIPYGSCRITDNGCLSLQVVDPKERRKGRRIIKPFTIHPFPDNPERCPVRCFLALRDHPSWAGRPTDSNLFVQSNNIRHPVTASTISTWLHRTFISLSTSEPRVNIRLLASSRALDLGVPLDDIVTLGNWTQASTFQNHYRRNHMAQVNFTTTVLTGEDDEFFVVIQLG